MINSRGKIVADVMLKLYLLVMTKVLSAKQKANELGISLSGLSKTRHLYKHIKKSPRKYLYFEEDGQEGHRPNKVEAPDSLANSCSRVKRRGVLFGNTRYSKAPSGSGSKLQLYNQMRSKMALENSIPKEEQESLTEALAHTVKKNYKEINEQRKAELTAKLLREDEATRKRMAKLRNPIKNVGGMKYPYTNLAYPTSSTQNWKYVDKMEDERNANRSWSDDIPSEKKYYY